MFLLPAGVRLQLCSTCAAIPARHRVRLPCSNAARLRQSYATVHVSQQNHVCNSKNTRPSAAPDKDLPNIPDLAASIRHALAQYTHATDSEKSAVLAALAKRTKALNTNTKKGVQRQFRRRLRAALSHDDLLTAVRDAVAGTLDTSASSPSHAVGAVAASGTVPKHGITANKEPDWSEILVQPSSDSDKVRLMDLEYIRDHVSLPSRKQYPNATPRLFDAKRLEDVITGAVQRRLKKIMPTQLKPTIQFKSARDLPKDVAAHTRLGLWACSVKLNLPQAKLAIECDAVASGPSKKSAKHAAWALLVARLHEDDDLRKLFPGGNMDTDCPDHSAEVQAGMLYSSHVRPKSSSEVLYEKETSSGESPAKDHTTSTANQAAGEETSHANLRMDLQYVAKHMPLPATDDYPVLNEVFGGLGGKKGVDPITLAGRCRHLCATEGYSSDLDMSAPTIQGTKFHVRTLRLMIPGSEQYVSMGVSQGKKGKPATAAAWLGMMSKLHTSGHLRRLENRLKIETYDTDNIEELATKDRLLPTTQQYPTAPKSLFEPGGIVSTIQAACQKTGTQLNMKFDTTLLDGNSMPGRILTRVTLRVKLPHFTAETYVSAMNKKIAIRGAWVEMLSKLHTSGALQQLFPSEGHGTPLSNMDRSDVIHQDNVTTDSKSPSSTIDAIATEEDMEISEVKQETLTKEKDAKVDIYNFAASIGATPLFEAQVMQLGRRQSRRKHKSTKAFRVSIKLPELNIQASALSRDLKTAEVAACIDFKQKAEHIEAARDVQRRPLSPGHHLLTTETANQFFDLYRKSRKGLSITIENELTLVAGVSRHQARILIDGRPFGSPVEMATKKAAEDLAHLVAAVEVVREEPETLAEFTQAMREGKAKILRDVRPVAVTMDNLTLSDMRKSLVEARHAGLPDERSTLTAEKERHYGTANRRTAMDDHKRQSITHSLQEAYKRYESDPRLEAIRRTKAELPMSQHSSRVLGLLSDGVYSIVIGATGSGKTTQVPQIILEDAIAKTQGGFCNIVCTQPRRLAASSVARRVSAELGEHLGHKVGYHVRGEARLPSPGGSITYCTTGILLQQLKYDADGVMDTMSHLIIDEVHERDMNIDFLLIILKKAVKYRLAAGKTVPQVVLMSATLDPELFANYLAEEHSKCPVLSVPGRTFPVQETYLHDILHDLRQHDERELEQLIDMDEPVSTDYLASEQNFSATVNGSVIDDQSAIDWKGKNVQTFDGDSQSVAREKEEALVPLPLVAATIAHISQTTSDGAILVFLPGLQEITGIQDVLMSRRPFGIDFGDTEKFKICLLHSAVPAGEQREVLDPPRPGCRKIILSTNIAETSVTVPDVKYVVDTGKLREKRYDQITRITKLQCTWASNSNVRQRAGRAGRVQEGFYYALYSKERRQKMTPSGLPEILRSDLQETCLSIKAQGFEEPVADFLGQAIEPPSAAAVKIAVENLQAIEALTSEQELTALGRVLSTLPVHPSLAKMVLLGIVFRCLDPMLVLSAMGSERPLFVNPISGREMVNAAQKKYATDDSDHLAHYQAFTDLRSIRLRVGQQGAYSHAMTNFLHFGAFRNIAQTAQQIEQILVEHGLLPDVGSREGVSTPHGGDLLNQNSNNLALVKGLLIAGFYPNLGVKRTSTKSRFFRTPTENNVLIHPGSQNNKKTWNSDEDFLYTYSTLAKSIDGDALFMRDTSLVTPLMVMLFGGKLQTSDWNRLEMDDWLRFDVRATRKDYAIRLILEYRKALDRMLHSAFKSLSALESCKSMADDAVVEQFASDVAKLLESEAGAGQQQHAQHWIPLSWKTRQEQSSAREL